jgi:hypothetical protein
VYKCVLTNELNNISIDNCELLIDSGNTACDLLITYHDAVKFGLQRSSIKIKVGGLTGSAFIVKMLPPLLVSFSLRVADEVQEKSASIDAWVMENEMSDADNKEVEAVPAKKRKLDGRDDSPVCTSSTINDPSPVKHLNHGDANLGKSGCKKLQLKYNFETNQISFLNIVEDLPEI